MFYVGHEKKKKNMDRDTFQYNFLERALSHLLWASATFVCPSVRDAFVDIDGLVDFVHFHPYRQLTLQ